MKTLVKSGVGKGNIKLMDMPEPDPGPYDVKIKVVKYLQVVFTELYREVLK